MAHLRAREATGSLNKWTFDVSSGFLLLLVLVLFYFFSGFSSYN